MIIDSSTLDRPSAYKLLIGSILPRAIAWVSTQIDGRHRQPRADLVLHGGGSQSARWCRFRCSPAPTGHAEGHVRQHPRHGRVRRQHGLAAAGPRDASLGLRVRSGQSTSSTPSASGRSPRSSSARRGSRARPSRWNAGSIASSRWGRTTITSSSAKCCGSTSATTSTCRRPDRYGGPPGVGRLAAEYTLVHNAFTVPLAPELLASFEGRRAERPGWPCRRLSPIDTKAWSASGATR
jgi:hypothetical protein